MRKNKKRKLLLLLRFLGLGFLFFVFGSLGLFFYYAKDLPRPERFGEREFFQTSKIYDRTGTVLLYNIYGEEKRTIVPLEQMPDYLQKAVIATEDANFYQHFGLDVKGILRSIGLNLKIGRVLYGGSTISQQLIRSSFLTREKTAKRKIREIILTLELERRYDKEQILEWYLNQVPFGANAYGVEAASQTYFNKPVSEISLPEAATLASLIKAPSRLSPYGEYRDELLARKDYVLGQMAREGYLKEEEAEAAKKEEVAFVEILNPVKAPHFTLYVRDLLEKKYGQEFLQEKGLKVITTLDWDLQQTAEEIVGRHAKANEGFRAFNAALIALDPATGEVISLVGSRDWFAKPYPGTCNPGQDCLFEPKFNAAVSLPGRQPGSAFKPFVYAEAFKKGYTDKTIVIDERTDFGSWGGKPYIPENYDGRFRGPVTLRQALAQSLNVPSVKVLAWLAGLEDSIKMAQNLGITTLTQPSSFYGLSLVLGGGEVRLLDMVSAYAVFGAEGVRREPQVILRVEDAQGEIIEENKSPPKKVLSSQVARLITDVLSDNIARAPMFGASSPLHFKEFRVAAKTGTTDSYKDAWTIGYTSSLAVGVWVGNNDNSPMARQPGVVLAGPMWREFFLEAIKKYPPKPFENP